MNCMTFSVKQPKQKTEKIPMYVIKAKNYESGQHWFSNDTMRFFGSKVPQDAYKKGDTAYFISTEDNFDRTEKRYTIRKANLKTGEIDSIGEFGQFKSKSDAQKELNKILNN